MSVRRNEYGTIVLDGNCPVEDAEVLLQMLQVAPAAVLDWTGASLLHTAVLQVILAAGAVPVGACGDSWVQQWVAPNSA